MEEATGTTIIHQGYTLYSGLRRFEYQRRDKQLFRGDEELVGNFRGDIFIMYSLVLEVLFLLLLLFFSNVVVGVCCTCEHLFKFALQALEKVVFINEAILEKPSQSSMLFPILFLAPRPDDFSEEYSINNELLYRK